MSYDSVIFWVTTATACQLTSVTMLAHALGLVWVFVLALITLVFSLDLDLLASALLAVYSSVFLFLTLLSVHVTAYWAPATTSPRKSPSLWLGALGLILVGAACGNPLQGQVSNLITWVDFNLAASQTSGQAVSLIHWAFYRLFVWETLAANLYILLALALATALVIGLRRGAQGASQKSAGVLARQHPARFQGSAPRIRVVTQFRRQTRRKNSSTLRTTL